MQLPSNRHPWRDVLVVLLTTILVSLLVCLNAHAMHVGEEGTCPAPYGTQPGSINPLELPPGHLKRVGDEARHAPNRGTARQIAKRYPQEWAAALRALDFAQPGSAAYAARLADLRASGLTPAERQQLTELAGDGYSGCIEQELTFIGTLQRLVENYGARAAYVTLLQTTDGRTVRVHGVPGWASTEPGRKVRVRGRAVGVGHDVLVDEFEQDGGAVSADETWRPVAQPNAPTAGVVKMYMVGFTHMAATSAPTFDLLEQNAIAAMAKMREISDPDGPTGPGTSLLDLQITVHPTIVDLGDISGANFCGYFCISERVRAATGWTATTPGEIFAVRGDFRALGYGWGGLGYLGAIPVVDQSVIVRLGFTNMTNGWCTDLHEGAGHGFSLGHENGLAGPAFHVPSRQGIFPPWTNQEYGGVGYMGATGTCLSIVPMSLELMGWLRPQDVQLVTAPGTYTVRGLKAYDPARPTLPAMLKMQRCREGDCRPDDWLQVFTRRPFGADANLTPNMTRGMGVTVRGGPAGWMQPIWINCDPDSVSGHIRKTCPLGQELLDLEEGWRVTVVAEDALSATVMVTKDAAPPTTIPTTTSTSVPLPPEIVVGYSVPTTSYFVGVPARFTMIAKMNFEPNTAYRAPDAVRWSFPGEGTSTVNPYTWTPTVPGWNEAILQAYFDGVGWSSEQYRQFFVNLAPTTTSTVGTSSTSTSMSTTTSSSTVTSTVSSTTTSTTTSSTTLPSYTNARILGPTALAPGAVATWTVEAHENGVWIAPACCWIGFTADGTSARGLVASVCDPCTMTMTVQTSGTLEGAASRGDGQWVGAWLRITVGVSSTTTSTLLATTTTSTVSTTSTTLEPACNLAGVRCRAHRDCTMGPGCDRYRCGRSRAMFGDGKKRCLRRGE